jgi:hypothetical protein
MKIVLLGECAEWLGLFYIISAKVCGIKLGPRWKNSRYYPCSHVLVACFYTFPISRAITSVVITSQVASLIFAQLVAQLFVQSAAWVAILVPLDPCIYFLFSPCIKNLLDFWMFFLMHTVPLV